MRRISDTRSLIRELCGLRGARGDLRPRQRIAVSRLISVLLSLFVWFGPSGFAAVNDTGDSVRVFVERLNQASMSFFSSGTELEARERCRAALGWAFDVPAMAKEALGSTWDKITDNERKEFLDAFEEDIVGAYLRRMRLPGTTLIFVGHRPPCRE